MARLEPLGNGIRVYVNDTYHFTTDTILLADFANVKKNDTVCDLGTGCGTIPLLWARYGKPGKVLAVDIQKEPIELLTQSIKLNNLSCIHPLLSDLNDLKGKTDFGIYDAVVCNPPYKLKGSGIENPEDSKAAINHETLCTLDDICSCASKLLKFSGRFIMCQRPERLSDIIETMRKYRLEPKRIRFVQQRINKSPKLILIESKFGANRGFLQTEPVLFIEDSSGNYSEEMKNIYGFYKEGYIS